MNARCIILIAGVAALFSLLVSCSENGTIAGGTDTETGGTRVVGCIVRPDGTPASNTVVSLIPTDYNPAEKDSMPHLLTGITNAFGYYSINTSEKGTFNIQAYDAESSRRLLLFGINCTDSVALAPVGVLTTPGALRLFLPDSIDFLDGYYFIPGTEYFALLGSKTDFIVIDSLPAGIVPIIRYASLHSSSSTILRNIIPIFSGDTTPVYNPAWQHCMPLFLNTTASGADVSTDVVQFPVMIRLNSGNFDFSQAKTDGADLRFAKSDNTMLPYEIEFWDAAAEAARIWVKVDTVHGNDSLQPIFMYWGNPVAVDSSRSERVFDTAVGFQGVWHLNENGNDTARDATANRFDGIAHHMASSDPAVAGPMGNGRAFDGESSFVTMPNTADGKLNFPEDASFSVSAWVYVDTFDNAYRSIVTKGFRQYSLWLTYYPLNNPQWEFSNFRKLTNWNMSSSPATSNQWVLLTGVAAANFQYLYCNGVLVAIRNAVYPNLLPRDTTNNLAIGRFLQEAMYPFRLGYCFFKGNINEVRICNVARNADWERLSYMNQRSDDRLVQIRPPTEVPFMGRE